MEKLRSLFPLKENAYLNRKFILFLILISFSLKLILIFILNPQASFLDEVTYTKVLIARSADDFSFQQPGPWSLYVDSIMLIEPSRALLGLGFDPLQSLRLTSAIYSTMSILLLALIMSLIPVVRDQDQSWKSKFLLARYITLVIFTFFPSRFLWSVSALRESACEFWFLVFISVFGRFLMKQPTDMRKSIFYALLTSSSLVGLFLIRWQTAILLSFTVIVLCEELTNTELIACNSSCDFFINFRLSSINTTN
jgi:hypothetical protein